MIARVLVTLVLAVAAGAGCTAVDAASCAKDDPACLAASLDPAQLRAAVEYVGPCYRFGRDLCDAAESCVGDIDRDACTDWWVDNVCSQPFDPAAMNRCANSVQLLACEEFDLSFDLSKWECSDLFPHPLDGWSWPVSGGAIARVGGGA